MVTLVGIEFAFLIGGLVVTEQVFNLNGLGQLFVDSVGRAPSGKVDYKAARARALGEMR